VPLPLGYLLLRLIRLFDEEPETGPCSTAELDARALVALNERNGTAFGNLDDLFDGFPDDLEAWYALMEQFDSLRDEVAIARDCSIAEVESELIKGHSEPLRIRISQDADFGIRPF
jgi:hypothetical protein